MAGEFDGGNLSTGRFFPASNCSGSFKPVHSGHLYVHEDKIEMLAFERFQRRGAVVRRNDSVTLFLEHVLEKEGRSEEHTSELQSQSNLVCRLLLEKKKKTLSNDRGRQPHEARSTPAN